MFGKKKKRTDSIALNIIRKQWSNKTCSLKDQWNQLKLECTVSAWTVIYKEMQLFTCGADAYVASQFVFAGSTILTGLAIALIDLRATELSHEANNTAASVIEAGSSVPADTSLVWALGVWSRSLEVPIGAVVACPSFIADDGPSSVARVMSITTVNWLTTWFCCRRDTRLWSCWFWSGW